MILKRIIICITLITSYLCVFAQAAFSNVVVTSSEGRVTIDYDLQPTVEHAVLKAVRLTVVFKGETLISKTVSGAIGTMVSFGLGRRMIWDCAADGWHFKEQAEILLEADCEVLPPPLEPVMVFVKGGTFPMGSNEGESDEKPVHMVTVGDFYMGKYEVTQAQYQAMMGTNPSSFKDCEYCPVEKVSWEDA
jgi:formylglycine-generating enzyme required for sulfatase activity